MTIGLRCCRRTEICTNTIICKLSASYNCRAVVFDEETNVKGKDASMERFGQL